MTPEEHLALAKINPELEQVSVWDEFACSKN